MKALFKTLTRGGLALLAATLLVAGGCATPDTDSRAHRTTSSKTALTNARSIVRATGTAEKYALANGVAFDKGRYWKVVFPRRDGNSMFRRPYKVEVMK